MSYTFWNNFVDNWKNLPAAEYIHPIPSTSYTTIDGWINPNLNPLMNSSGINDFSLQYLPEPWWGNNGKHALDSVVINYNPGGGGAIQHHLKSTGLFGFLKFQDFVESEATGATNKLPGTNKWHKNQRANRIFNSLTRIGIPLSGNQGLQNHLSIELIPWHTANTSTISSYINNNCAAIFDNCIKFAANESLRIGNSKLKEKVILRLSEAVTLILLKNFSSHGICTYTILNRGCAPTNNGRFLKFSINSLPNVEFISIWGKNSRNDFPSNIDMDYIFLNVI